MALIEVQIPVTVQVSLDTNTQQITKTIVHDPGYSKYKVISKQAPTITELITIATWPWSDFTFESNPSDFQIYEIDGIDSISKRPVLLMISSDSPKHAAAKARVIYRMDNSADLLNATAKLHKIA